MKQIVFKRVSSRFGLGLCIVVSAVALTVGGSLIRARADSVQDQINSLNADSSAKQAQVGALQLQAASYQDAINKLQAQIEAIQAAIAASQARQTDLQNQITAAQTELDHQKAVLGADIKASYVDGEPTTIEMLASSKNLSDFVNKQEYRNAVQSKIQVTLQKITKLQNQLRDQKNQVDQLLQTQKAQQNQLDADQAQQNNLLAFNQSQQASYNDQIKVNSSKVKQLQAQQRAINNRGSTTVNVPPSSGGSGGMCDNGGGNGNYPMPWCNAPQDTIITLPGDNEGDNRECTSYAYWYFTSVEGRSLHVSGNAGQWGYTASGPGVYVDGTPAVGALGVLDSGPYGHVMVIRAVGPTTYQGVNVPAGQVLVSDMNHDYDGHFSYNLRVAASLSYIH